MGIGSRIAISDEVDDQERTVVVFNPNHDEYLVVFQNSWSGGGIDVAAQRVDGDGSLLSWANIAAGGAAFRFHPTATFHPGLDQYLIAYTVNEAPTWHHQLRGKVAASDLAGVSTAPEVVIFDNPSDNAVSPAVAAGGEGYIAQFTLPITPFAIRLGSDGSPVGSTNPFQLGVAVGNMASTPTRANAVAPTETVGYVSLWHDILYPDGDVHARVVSPFADSLLTGQLPVAVGPGHEEQVALACAPWGTCLVAYQNDANVVGRVLRFNLFGDGFESGDFAAWPVHLP